MPRPAFSNSALRVACRRWDSADSAITPSPSSAQRGTALPKWVARTACITSCGTLSASTASSGPDRSTRALCSPFASKVKVDDPCGWPSAVTPE